MSAGRNRHPLGTPLGRVAAYAAVVFAIAALFALCWMLREVLLLTFGAILVATIIRAGARPLMRRLKMGERWAVMLVALVLVLTGAGMFWLFGHQIASQLQGLSERLPRAVAAVREWLESNQAGRFLLERASALAEDGSWLENAPRVLAISATTIGHMFLMLFVGIYLAMNPRLYRDGFVRLFPEGQRKKLHHALNESGDALRKWLLGQLVSMSSVGVLTGVGLWIVGAPLPLGLGIMAGLFEFIPAIGPVLAFVPGVLVALTEGSEVALYAAIVFIVVQQLEGSVIMPLAQRWAVALPPAYGLVAVLSFSLLFGFLGILFGSPLAVVAMCLVQNLYLRNGVENNSARGGEAPEG